MLTYNVKNYGATGNGVKNDTGAIQAALDAAHAAGGGRVYIPTGTYILTGTGSASDGALRVYSNTELYGDGMGETELKLQDGWSSKITGMIRTPVNQITHDVVIRDLSINGNRDNSTADVDGIMTGVLPGSPKQDTHILIERVEIHDVSRIAFNPHEQTTNLTIRDSVAHHNSWDGFIADFVSNAVYENNVAYANDRHGFNVVTHSEEMVLRNNTAYDNAEYGIIVQRGAGSQTIPGWENMLNNNILIEGNTLYGNDRGIGLKQTEDSQIIGNNIYANTREGIYLEGARNNVIDGNTVNALSDAIEIRNYSGTLGGPADSYGNVVINNTLNSTAYALIESGLTTTGNTYAENVINTPTKLGSGATVLSDSALLTYTHITITSALPANYGHEVPVPPVIVVPPEVFVDQNLRGTDGHDTLTGASGNDTLKGGLGNDTLIGGKGNDTFEGNAGNDIFHGGLGADKIKGGDGVDTYVYHSLAEGGDIIADFRSTVGEKLDFTDLFAPVSSFNGARAMEDGFIRLQQDVNNVSLYVDMDGKAGNTSQEVLYLTLQDAQVSKIALANFILPTETTVPPVVIPPVVVPPVVVPPVTPPVVTPPVTPPASTTPTEGNDTLTGTNGDNKMQGRGGNDTLYGNSGNDYLEGNAGNDRLIGGHGIDTLKGGDGADVFAYEDILDGGDTIIDFRAVDRIDLAKLLEDFSGSVPTTVGGLVSEGYLSIENKGANVFSLSVDVDGRAGAEGAVHLVNVTVEANKIFDANYITI